MRDGMEAGEAEPAVVPNVLSIAGSDPSGGAGIQADLKTFAALGCNGLAAIAALTAQNSRGVRAIHAPPPEFLAAQLAALFDDIEIAAVKIGMLGDAANAHVVAAQLASRRPAFVVFDPVLAASSGDSLAGADLVDALRDALLPRVDLLTPNVSEAARLAGDAPATDLAGLRRQGARLLRLGAPAVLMKGGHIAGNEATDLLIEASGETLFTAPRMAGADFHGTGCALSAAIAALRAQGHSLREAVGEAKQFLIDAMRGAGALHVGSGAPSLNHFARISRA